ncbi:hypothetical protein E2C01_082464 [Portunus trituberculatus]|uniref:Uncharacterized protein n=1 Tax=Portunus trituberculatus TaxID=210409 RepID=A0A5B7J3X4_PORTR|nr:hypothetical protein [Portunus trituberculatus]
MEVVYKIGSVESCLIDREFLGQWMRSEGEFTASCQATPRGSPQQAIAEYTVTSSSPCNVP